MSCEERTQSSDCDLESETFDAKTSLLADEEQMVVPIPSAHTYNNIDEYFSKSFGKTNAFKHLPSISSAKPEPIVRTLKIEESVSRHKRRELSTVLTKMCASVKGPNHLLYKALNNRIKVLIRRRKSVVLFAERFGWISGVLVVFDKHHNLCLTDCDETYQTLSADKVVTHVNHHFKQVLVRGDNIVLISFI